MAAELEEALIAHAQWCAPDEACGLLAVDAVGQIRFFYPIENLDAAVGSYTLDPRQLLHAADHAETMGWELGGVMHSHPKGKAYPSRTDVERWAAGSWLQVVVVGAKVGYFRIDRGKVRRQTPSQ